MENEKRPRLFDAIVDLTVVATGFFAFHFSQIFILDKFGVEPFRLYQSFVIFYAYAFLTRKRKNVVRTSKKESA